MSVLVFLGLANVCILLTKKLKKMKELFLGVELKKEIQSPRHTAFKTVFLTRPSRGSHMLKHSLSR